MELKDYQVRTLDAFTRWQNELVSAQKRMQATIAALENFGAEVEVPPNTGNYPKSAWKKLAAVGEVANPAKPYIDRTAAAGFPIPHICLKVPTGGGKTLLAAAAVERLNQSCGLVLWMVPSNAIYEQTKDKLWDRQHPYRRLSQKGKLGRRW